MNSLDENEIITILEDEPKSGRLPVRSQRPWRLLIVDDDEDVHRATTTRSGTTTA